MKGWALDDIDWEVFDRAKVDADLLKVVKAASLVEKNGDDYARYLEEVFADDADFCAQSQQWAREEVQHGDALAKWATLADPDFDFDGAFEKFAAEIKLPENIDASVRGSRTGELVARCIVECGTSSMYTALAAATDEPVLKQICNFIAADELRHYKLFYEFEKQYLKRENIGRFRRVYVALSRARESEDDELAYAYYAANHANDGPYDRETYTRKYSARVYGFFEFHHLERTIALAFKSIGLKPHGWLNMLVARAAFGLLRRKVRRNREWERRSIAA
jgi:rubrerythrin